jgi:hypothetical protein
VGQRALSVLGATLLLALVACGSGEVAGTSTSTTQTASTVTTAAVQPTTTGTPLGSTTTLPGTTTSSTTTSASGLPGDPIDFGPAEGDILAVVGVAHDDVLNLRAVPGGDQEILAGIPPLYSDLIALGATRQLAASMWIKVDYSGLEGWVNLRFIAYLGAIDDITAQILSNLGETPAAETMPGLGLLVADSIVAEAPDASVVMSAAPTVGDLGEVTYDIVGFGDDSVRGTRIHVFGQPEGDGFVLKTVEASPFCSRGVDSDGVCI